MTARNSVQVQCQKSAVELLPHANGGGRWISCCPARPLIPHAPTVRSAIRRRTKITYCCYVYDCPAPRKHSPTVRWLGRLPRVLPSGDAPYTLCDVCAWVTMATSVAPNVGGRFHKPHKGGTAWPVACPSRGLGCLGPRSASRCFGCPGVLGTVGASIRLRPAIMFMENWTDLGQTFF